MDQGQFNRASDLFRSICDLPVPERRQQLARVRADDPVTAAEVEALLESEAGAEFLESPALGASFHAGEVGGGPGAAEEPESADTVAGHRIGPFVVRRLLSAGGTANVYEAEQDAPRRTVALKVLRGGPASRSTLRRFRAESEILGRLEHPGIARVYEAGVEPDAAGGPGSLYFAMEFVRGAPITAWAAEHALDARAKVELMVRVCEAVQHAHLKGVIHRDLKPANILVDEAGRPRVLDFGVARAIKEHPSGATSATEAGQLIGTLWYMSPEQVSGDPARVDTRSDVYALGVVLYELLAGQLPCAAPGDPVPQTIRAIREREPAPLSAADRSLRGDLSTIAAKALEKDPARRYQTAAELGEDLRRFLRHEPIAARPASTVYQLRKLARRNRPATAAVLALAVTLPAAAVASTLLALWALRRSEQAVLARRQAEDVSAMLTQLIGGFNVLHQVTMAEVLEQADRTLAKGAVKDPALEATLREYVGDGFLKLGRSDRAEAHVDRALEIRRALGRADFELARSLRLAAEARFGLKRPEEGRTLLRQALEVRRVLYGPTHVWSHPDDDLGFFVNYYLPDEPEARLDRARAESERRAQALLAADALAHPRPSGVAGGVVLHDDFNGPEVSPEWSLRLEEAAAWTHRFDSSRLIAQDIRPRRVWPSAGGPNSLVTLERQVPPVGDFHLRVVLGWDSRGDCDVMHQVHAEVFSSTHVLGTVTFQDVRAFFPGGQPVAQLGMPTLPVQRGPEQPPAGEAVAEIERIADTVTIYWNGAALIQGNVPGPAVGIRLRFGHTAIRTADYTTRFAPVWFDRMELRGVPLP